LAVGELSVGDGMAGVQAESKNKTDAKPIKILAIILKLLLISKSICTGIAPAGKTQADEISIMTPKRKSSAKRMAPCDKDQAYPQVAPRNNNLRR
jgi:hypothetical protein